MCSHDRWGNNNIAMHNDGCGRNTSMPDCGCDKRGHNTSMPEYGCVHDNVSVVPDDSCGVWVYV